MLFKNINERKRRVFDKKYIHKAMKFSVNIYQRTKKLFVTVQPKKPC